MQTVIPQIKPYTYILLPVAIYAVLIVPSFLHSCQNHGFHFRGLHAFADTIPSNCGNESEAKGDCGADNTLFISAEEVSFSPSPLTAALLAVKNWRACIRLPERGIDEDFSPSPPLSTTHLTQRILC